MENSTSKKSNLEMLIYFVAILLVGGLAFFAGTLWEKVQSLENGGPVAANNNQVAQGQQPSLVEKLTKDKADKIPEVTDEDHARGDVKSAKVYLVEYSDLQCPYCANFHSTAQQVADEYKGQVAWVYRHFPLDSIHPKARPAANAAECIAALNGEDTFWNFTDKIFEDQTQLNDMAAVAKAVGVNESAFQTCLDAKKYESVVDEQYKGGSTAGVSGTPGIFIVNAKTGDATIVRGALPFDKLKPLIDEALK